MNSVSTLFEPSQYTIASTYQRQLATSASADVTGIFEI